MPNAKRTISIDVNDDSGFEYGQRLYVIDSDDMHTFKDKCPVCGGTRKIVYNGFLLNCPKCDERCQKEIRLRNYIILEYILNGFSVNGPRDAACFDDNKIADFDNLPIVTWYGFARWPSGEPSVDKFSGLDLEPINPETVNLQRNCSGAAFLDYHSAQKFCRRLHERQKAMLDEFNQTYGTNHKYPQTWGSDCMSCPPEH